MKKVTLDSNVWISAIFWKGEAARIIDLAERDKIKIFCSKEILLEIAEVLSKESKFKATSGVIKEIIEKIADLSHDIIIKTKTNIIQEDPDDNKILDCAFNSRSDYLISYDRHLLNLKKFKKIIIIHPTGFLEEAE